MIRFFASIGVALLLGAILALAMATVKAPRLVGPWLDLPDGVAACRLTVAHCR